MEKYEKYKDSGIEWIGEIPEHWELTRLDHLLSLLTDGTHQTPDYKTQGIPFISIKDMSSGRIDFSQTKFIDEATHKELSKHACVEKGDIIFSRIGTLGVFIKVETEQVFDIFVSLGLMKVKDNCIDTDYLVYYLSSDAVYSYIQLVKAGGDTSAAKFNLSDVAKTIIALPSKSEQESISRYLSSECSKINSLIATQQKRVELLKELRQSVITKAVTKGLNPNAKMKDSGVEWIGDVPEHWKILPLKHTGSFGNGLTYSPKDVKDDGVLVLRASNIQNSKLAYEDCVYVESVPQELMVKKGDIIICSRNGSAALVGKCAIVDSDINATFGAFMMRYVPYIDKRYGFYLLQVSMGFYKGLFSTTTINQLTKGVIDQMVVAIPVNKEEQRQIASYIEQRISSIDSNIVICNRQIALLKEYKQSLITEVVTGKRKVC